uniref:Uncharacterized protein n=1 Tax=Utricularia reniformis TaxID=192314 RepID=A0A1Y0B133_9LAMI|nr:hypothetical protein AEK19_MT0942 [Utricularia reniformis]ART31165.1 hypothetical protein AEK19_MT0942 [Utricularia reniformis]
MIESIPSLCREIKGVQCTKPMCSAYIGYKIEKNPIGGRQAKSAVRLHGLNKTQYCTGQIRFAARLIVSSVSTFSPISHSFCEASLH